MPVGRTGHHFAELVYTIVGRPATNNQRRIGDRSLWARQGLFCPYYTTFSVGSGQSRGETRQGLFCPYYTVVAAGSGQSRGETRQGLFCPCTVFSLGSGQSRGETRQGLICPYTVLVVESGKDVKRVKPYFALDTVVGSDQSRGQTRQGFFLALL